MQKNINTTGLPIRILHKKINSRADHHARKNSGISFSGKNTYYMVSGNKTYSSIRMIMLE